MQGVPWSRLALYLLGRQQPLIYTQFEQHLNLCQQVLEHCREVYASRQARSGGDDAGSASAAQAAAAAAATAAAAKGGRAPTAREVAFRAAVNACRKRGGAALASSPGKPAASSANPT